MKTRSFIVRTLSTFFYVGYLPIIPGTFASIAGVLLFYLIKDNILIYILFTFILLILGFIVTGQAERLFDIKDPRYVVIDEVAGMFLSLLFMPYYNIQVLCAAFITFRILDTFKPYPAGGLERFQGSLGIMSDDIVAGLYTNFVLQIALRLASFKIS